MMRRNLLFVIFLPIALFITSCTKEDSKPNSDWTPGDPWVDLRDDQSYKTVQIGYQVWMAENLNYYIEDSHYYDNDSVTYSEFGRLYKYYDALSICPDGWHLPSDIDWKELESFLGMNEYELNIIGNRGKDEGIGTKLKPGGSAGFDVQYAGIRDRYDSGIFMGFGERGIYCTTTQSDIWPENAYYREVYADSTIIRRSEAHKTYGFSVRCIKDQ